MTSYRKTSTGWKATVSKRKNGKLTQTSKRGFRTKNEAIKWAAAIEADDNGIEKKKKNMLFVDYFDKWVSVYKAQKLQSSTLRKYTHASKILHEHFPDTSIKDMHRSDYQKFINEYGATHSKETVQQINIAVRACIKSAIFDDYITKDFTTNVELVFNHGKTRKVDYLSVEEIKRLITVTVEKLDTRYTSRYMILTALYTGMRLGEIAALTWKDIDFMHQTISVSKSWSFIDKKFKQTKTSSSVRTIKVPADFLKALSALKVNHSSMVFLNNQNRIPSSNAVNKVLKELLAQAGINRQGYHFHSIRHSHVAYLLYQGIDLYAISKRLGHSDMTITAKKYAYLIDEHREQQEGKITQAIGQLSGQHF